MAKPKVQVLVDWNDDGDFLDANEDITADVVALAFDALRDVRSDYAIGSVLDLQLKNDDHKYSPSKGTITGLKPGRNIWVRVWYPYDSFVDASGGTIENHVPEEDADWAWVNLDGLNRGFQVPSGVGYATPLAGTGSSHASYLEFNDSDVTIACKFGRGTDTTDHGGLLLRFVDINNYAYVRVTGSAIELRKVIAGSDTLVRADSFTWPISTSKFLVVTLHGVNCRVLVDRIEVMDTTMLNDAAINSGTKHGLHCDDAADHQWEDFGGFRSLFWGRVGEIRPRPRKGAEYCYLKGYDMFEELKRAPVRGLNVLVAPRTTTNVLGDVLAFADASNTAQQSDTGETLVVGGNEEFKPMTNDGLNLIYQLQDEEDGFIRIDGDGYIRIEGRNHRTSAPHTTSKATIKDSYDGSNPGFTDLSWDDGHDQVENRILAKVRRGEKTLSVKVWESDQAKDTSVSIQFGASETKDFVAEIKDFDVATGLTSPIATTDYTANTLANGTGTDITSELTASVVETSRYFGGFVKLRIVFGATAGYLTKLEIRGDGWTLQDPHEVLAEDATSKSDYGERRKTIDCLWIARDNVARDLVANRLARRKDPKTLVEVTLQAGDKVTLHHMIQRLISDRVTVSYSDMGISEDFFIEGHSWRIDEGGTKVSETLLLRGV